MKKIIFFLMCGLLFSAQNVLAINADDFLPPVQANSPQEAAKLSEVQSPSTINEETSATGEKAIHAENAQDSINASMDSIRNNPQWEEVGGGCKEIKFPSGFGFVASGEGTYSVMPNPTATLIAQRNAYQIAYINAKKNLAGYLNSISTNGMEKLLEEYKTLTASTNTLSNTNQNLTENISEFIKGILKGYVVYNVSDLQEDNFGKVIVTIVATPKTLSANSRINSSSLSANSVRNGLNEVLTELSSGLLAPVGGKVVTVPQTGEMAFVGFGSAVVPDNPDKGIQAKLALNAQKMAQIRARNALCGIILGDEIEASSKMEAGTQDISKQFEEVQKDDPANSAISENEVSQLENQVKNFVSTQLTSDQISSVRKGVLPPGINVKTFMNPEKTIAQSIAVYVPSVSATAAKANSDMQKANLVKKPNSISAQGNMEEKHGKMPAQGPSGQVTNDADL